MKEIAIIEKLSRKLYESCRQNSYMRPEPAKNTPEIKNNAAWQPDFTPIATVDPQTAELVREAFELLDTPEDDTPNRDGLADVLSSLYSHVYPGAFRILSPEESQARLGEQLPLHQQNESKKQDGLKTTERAIGEHLAVLDIAMSSLDQAVDTYRNDPREHGQLAHFAIGTQRILSGLWDNMSSLHALLREFTSMRQGSVSREKF